MVQNKNQIISIVLLCLIVFDFMVYPDPKFLISKTEKWPQFVSEVILEAVFLILCHHARHLQQIH